MEDVQARRDERGIELDQVGVSGVRFPISVLDRQNEVQHTVATISMSVNLPREFKGTHMSRFIEILNDHQGEMTLRTLPAVLEEVQSRLKARNARIEVEFPYFVQKRAPVSGSAALIDYHCRFVVTANSASGESAMEVTVPVTSVCPCSKEISDYGAHNQRGLVTIHVVPRSGDFIWIEELVDVAEQAASCPVYPLLKRDDERVVTMAAYDNPVFVEDIVRNVAHSLRGDHRISKCAVRAENEESIHNHAAFAEVSWRQTGVDPLLRTV